MYPWLSKSSPLSAVIKRMHYQALYLPSFHISFLNGRNDNIFIYLRSNMWINLWLLKFKDLHYFLIDTCFKFDSWYNIKTVPFYSKTMFIDYFIWDRIMIWIPEWPSNHYVDLADLKLRVSLLWIPPWYWDYTHVSSWPDQDKLCLKYIHI